MTTPSNNPQKPSIQTNHLPHGEGRRGTGDVGGVISFIIPTYNTPPEQLKQCIESIASLPLSDDEREIIIIDDGSIIPVDEQLHTSIYKNIKLIRQSNNGLGAARNHGMDIAKGKYLQFVDADDYLIADQYQPIAETMRKGEADMILFHFANRKNIKHRTTPYLITGGEYMLQNNLRATACLYAFKNTPLRFKCGILHEDELFTTLFTLQAKAVSITNLPLYYYRHSENSITTTITEEQTQRRLNDTHDILKEMKQCLDSNLHCPTPQHHEALQRKTSQLTMDYLYNTFRLTHSFCEVRKRIKQLKKESLYPLPLHCYTWKYALAAAITRML